VLPAGCDPGRRGTLHHANGATLGPAGDVPCLTTAFFGFGESEPVVTSNGTVMYGGAYPPAPNAQICTGFITCGNIARTVNKGGTWQFVPMATESANGRGGGDPQLWLDPLTGRVFSTQIGSSVGFPPFPDPRAFDGLCQTELNYTDNSGETWTTDYPLGFGCPAFDFPHLFTGPPTTAADKAALRRTGAYPEVVYVCKGADGLVPNIPPRQCWKSLDSGHSFTEIGGSPTADVAGIMGASTADIHGRLYGMANGDLNISSDEGVTWNGTPVPAAFSRSDLAVDRDGDVYLAAVVNKLPEITYSTDQGKTWSTPIAVEMPGVRQAHKPVIAVPALGTPGRVVVAYIGNGETSENPDPQTWTCAVPILPCGRVGGVYHGYITTTTDIFAAKPRFMSVQVDSNAHPLLPFGYNPAGATVTASRSDFIGISMDANGRPWAYFYRDVCANTGSCIVHDPYPEDTNWIGVVATIASGRFARTPGR
jgi:hypothetical protein